jgi:hypothetical protein
LWRDDLNHLTRHRRLCIARPAVDQGKIHPTPEIAQRLPRKALANFRIVGETSLAEIADDAGRNASVPGNLSPLQLVRRVL